MTDKTIWQLVQDGQFIEACNKADKEFEVKKDILILRNKLYVLFLLKKYEECVSLSEKIIKMNEGQTDSDFIFQGIGYWLLNRPTEAIKSWAIGQKSKYTDSAGGVEIQLFLFFGAIKMNDITLKNNVIKKLTRLLKNKIQVQSPASLGKFILNEMSEQDLLLTTSSTPILHERQLCQIYFSIALKKLERSDLIGYFENLQCAVDFGSRSFLPQMYYLAIGEIDALKK